MPQVTYRKDYRPYPFELDYCRLRFDIYTEHVNVKSQIQFRQNPKFVGKYRQENCILDGEGLELIELKLDGRSLVERQDYHFGSGKLELYNTAERKEFCFEAELRIDPYNNTALEGMYRSGQILCSQNEASGFRHITFYPDRPDVMSYFSTEITADKGLYPCLLSNGNLLEQRELGAARHYVRWEDPFAKPAYLYAIVAGDLECLSDSFRTCSARQVRLEIYTDKGKSERARFAMESLKQAMRWDEEKFGREYDLDLFMIVAVDSFNFGAMENKGLNIFNSSLVLASEETANDTSYERIASVIAHEYFHNWTGNRITCRDWFQLTLKEGLTVYRDELFSEDHFGREVCRIEQIRNLRNNQYPEDAGSNRHPIRPDSFIDINNFYTQTVYQKGAAVIRMMASYLGEEGFRKGMDKYFAQFDGQAVTCDDFVDAIEEGSRAAGLGKDLSLLRRWYEQAGTPQVYVHSTWDGKDLRLQLRQENPNAAQLTTASQVSGQESESDYPPLAFPLPLALYSDSGELLLKDQILMSEREQELHYNLLGTGTAGVSAKITAGKRPIPSLLLDHISPVELHYAYEAEELLVLATADCDSFNRYEALQKYLQNIILAVRPDRVLRLAAEFIAMMGKCVGAWQSPTEQADPRDKRGERLSPNYIASLLTPPGLEVLAATQSPPQYQELHFQREKFCRELASELEKDFLATYHALGQGQYTRDRLAIGKRSLRNTLLHYLCRLEKAEYIDLAYQQYQSSDNMTDSFAALQALAYGPGASIALSQEAIAQFSQRWAEEPLLQCKCFALQAGIPRSETLERVQELEQHPLFDKSNPNMMRSLYSVLGHNLVTFHDKSGKAYEFLAERILQIDSSNSMMSAGLATCYVAYQKLDAELQAAMKKALTQIIESKGISERLFEIVSKTLGSH